MRAVQDWFALMLYELCWVLDFCKLKIPDTVFPFAVLSESADGKAWSMGVNEPVGGGGSGTIGVDNNEEIEAAIRMSLNLSSQADLQQQQQQQQTAGSITRSTS